MWITFGFKDNFIEETDSTGQTLKTICQNKTQLSASFQLIRPTWIQPALDKVFMHLVLCFWPIFTAV